MKLNLDSSEFKKRNAKKTSSYRIDEQVIKEFNQFLDENNLKKSAVVESLIKKFLVEMKKN